ncbi:hypothetical protein GPJ56_002053 [Histomonas meleagridis]|uniref:uncharacterized protein n=1 Tax=Histomonas meleagridis TaxID=135588 RepID=UPI00355AB87D|nr:hypothetical protein GPJ56_002053 [Histomonas meleagridis]KAH0800878.1 hypothetical protein GO595_006329 [Histomonas meleagridis]
MQAIKSLDDSVPTKLYVPIELVVRSIKPEPISDAVHCTIETLDKLIEIGDNFFSQKRYRSAFTFYNESGTYGVWRLFHLLYKIKAWKTITDKHNNIIDFIPNTNETNVMIAEAYEHIGKTNEAFEIYKNCLINGFASCEVQTGLSRCFTSKQNFTSAAVSIMNALNIDSQNPEAILQSAKIYLLSSNYDSAVKTLLRCPAIYKHIPQFFQSDLSFMKQFLGTVTVLSVNTKSLLSLCRTLYKHGSVAEPLNILKSAYFSTKHNIDVTLLFFSILLEQNQFSLILDHSYEFARTYIHTPIRGVGLTKFYEILTDLYEKEIDDQITDIPFESFSTESYLGCILCILIALFLEGNISGFANGFLDPKLGFYSYYETLFSKKRTSSITEMYIFCERASILNQSESIKKKNNKTIMCIGDHNVIHSSFLKMKIKNTKFTIMPHPFYNLSIWKLRKASNSPQKERFFSLLQTLPDYNSVIFVLGTYDCEIEIPKFINKCLWNTVSKAIAAVVEIYVSLLKIIMERNPGITIYVHPALSRFIWSAPIVNSFNAELEKALPESVVYLKKMEGTSRGPLTLTQIDNFGIPKGYSQLLIKAFPGNE